MIFWGGSGQCDVTDEFNHKTSFFITQYLVLFIFSCCKTGMRYFNISNEKWEHYSFFMLKKLSTKWTLLLNAWLSEWRLKSSIQKNTLCTLKKLIGVHDSSIVFTEVFLSEEGCYMITTCKILPSRLYNLHIRSGCHGLWSSFHHLLKG